MTLFFFLPHYMQEHNLSSLQKSRSVAELFPALAPHQWGRARKALAFFLSAVSAHQNNHTMTVLTHKKRNTSASSKPPGRQSQVGNVPPLKSTVPKQKAFPWSFPSKCILSFAPQWRGQHKLLCANCVFTLTESGHQLKNGWQKKTSQKWQSTCYLQHQLHPSNCTHWKKEVWAHLKRNGALSSKLQSIQGLNPYKGAVTGHYLPRTPDQLHNKIKHSFIYCKNKCATKNFRRPHLRRGNDMPTCIFRAIFKTWRPTLY